MKIKKSFSESIDAKPRKLVEAKGAADAADAAKVMSRLDVLDAPGLGIDDEHSKFFTDEEQVLADLRAQRLGNLRKGDPKSPEVVEYESMEKTLDYSLQTALRLKKQHVVEGWPNLWFEGAPGVGKTSRVRAWARKNGVHLFVKSAGTIGAEDFQGVIATNSDKTGANRLALQGFAAQCNQPNTVLFLDEFNKAQGAVRSQLLTLIQSHVMGDESKGESEIFLNNLLFVVMCTNPASSGYQNNALAPEERNRYEKLYVYSDKWEWLDWYRGEMARRLQYEDDVEERANLVAKYKIAKLLVSSDDFEFSDTATVEARDIEQAPFTSTRSLELLLNKARIEDDPYYDPATDGDNPPAASIKNYVKNRWSRFCDANQKDIIEDILAGYTDVDDKANQVLQQGTESSRFKIHQKSAAEKLADLD